MIRPAEISGAMLTQRPTDDGQKLEESVCSLRRTVIYGGLHVDSDVSDSDEESLKGANEIVPYSKEPEWAEAELLA